ncbi:DUF559 domain-containing protein [Micromonospora olivasterospora]|uniref:Uncharacterized protein DUF559 n=1 Tax=Micromonospora olivasterospora TaxID=1880 RepID=A0A562I7N5_MICOL|nr:DUF559 domain-containing protein [Micromonospora olivasterospora]TWH66912.1 uncharacterized protein DUF559 [Micromonospora olivasterospora]
MPPQPHRPGALEWQVFRGSEAVRSRLLTRHQLRGASWLRVRHDVYADVRLRRDHGLACRAATLRLPPEAVLAGPSAAYLHGVEHAASFADDVHVLVSRSARVDSQPGIRVHTLGADLPIPTTAGAGAATIAGAGAAAVVGTGAAAVVGAGAATAGTGAATIAGAAAVVGAGAATAGTGAATIAGAGAAAVVGAGAATAGTGAATIAGAGAATIAGAGAAAIVGAGAATAGTGNPSAGVGASPGGLPAEPDPAPDCPCMVADDADGLPRSQPAQAAWETAVWLEPVRAVAIVDTLLGRGLTTRAALAAIADHNADRPGGRRAQWVFGLADAGAQSPPESYLRVRLVLAGLPRPVTQHPVRLASGLVLHPDLAWPGLRVAVEYDGHWHADAEQLHRDRQRLNHLVAAGWVVLHVTSRRLHQDFPAVVREVRAALVARGWRR